MTYKTRQEVLRAAADWMDVCEKAGINAVCKCTGIVKNVEFCSFDNPPDQYEFPLALLEGKEVWVGSEVYNNNGKFTVWKGDDVYGFLDGCSWNPPKPATVMVELSMKLVEFRAGRVELNNDEYDMLLLKEDDACKKALENLK